MRSIIGLISLGLIFILLSCQQKAGASQHCMKQNVDSGALKPRIFITGSTAGLGQLAAKTLIAKGYRVVVHARNEKRAADVRKSLPGAEAIVIGDLSSIAETKKLASAVNALGDFDAIILNAGVYYEPSEVIFRVNVLAPYILTSLIHKPKRLIYISSDMHLSGSLKLDQLAGQSPDITYPDSKLQLLTISMAAARKWSGVYVNAVHPGWVPTRMGGPDAPDDLVKGYETQVWLAEGTDKATHVSGKYFFHQQYTKYNEAAVDTTAQEKLLKSLEKITGVPFPSH